MIMPIKVQGQFTAAKGKTLGAFAYYAMCQGQQESASLGYSPMPYNLVQDSFQQITRIPGVVVENVNVQSCNNPTFSTTSPNLLAQQAPQPQACDKQGATQCATGTAGDQNPTTLSGGSLSSATGASTSTGGRTSASSGSSSSPGATSGAAGSGATRSGSTRGSGATGSTGARTGTVSGRQTTASTIAGCDPSAGSCGATSDVTTGAGTVTDSPALQSSGSDGSATGLAAVATPTTLPAHSGWTGLTLALLIALLTILLVLAPGLTSLYLSRRSE